MDINAALKGLPAVARLLASRPVAALARKHGLRLVTELVREELARLRQEVLSGRLQGERLRSLASGTLVADAVGNAAHALLAPRPRPVINATGVVVHTNLGRAVLSREAAQDVATAASSYMDLEYDLADGRRGSRQSHLEPLMARLFPGYAFTVVNNNAAALLLCLRALSRGKQVVVSRGELVEIGGSFRVPDIMATSGARLVEVGTTNRTRLSDYENALSPRTGLILKVHTSNFRIVGFTEETTIQQLAGLSRRVGLPLLVDWGSGDLVDLGPLGIQDEIPVSQVLAQGADLVSFSGDKLLGGPQAGFVVGRPDLLARLRRDPLARVCRIDRLLLGAIHRTLAAYVSDRAFDDVPTLRMIGLTSQELERRAVRIARAAGRRSGAAKLIHVIEGVSRTGGGSSPTGERPTRLVAVLGAGRDAGSIERRLRTGDPPIIGRLQDGRLLLDPRTVLPEQEPVLVERLSAALAEALAAERPAPAKEMRKKPAIRRAVRR